MSPFAGHEGAGPVRNLCRSIVPDSRVGVLHEGVRRRGAGVNVGYAAVLTHTGVSTLRASVVLALLISHVRTWTVPSGRFPVFRRCPNRRESIRPPGDSGLLETTLAGLAVRWTVL